MKDYRNWFYEENSTALYTTLTEPESYIDSESQNLYTDIIVTANKNTFGFLINTLLTQKEKIK